MTQQTPALSGINPDASPAMPVDPTLDRLNSQIDWYDKESNQNNRWHKLLRVTSLIAAAAIPVLTALSVPAGAAAALGGAIVALEGIQGLFQFQRNWIAFGATRESLKHEKYLYLASAGAYRQSRDRHRLLAERVETLVARETSDWASVQQFDDQPEKHEAQT